MPANKSTSFTSMTGGQQTMLSWARPIDSLESLPELFIEPYLALVGQTSALPYTLFVPLQGKSLGAIPFERLLCIVGDNLHVFELGGGRVEASEYPLNDIYYHEMGNVLLFSWFSINTLDRNGNPAALIVEFNQASLRHFIPFFCRIRPGYEGRQQPELQIEQSKFNYLSSQNFKYMNFARESLLPGQKVIQTLFQPAIRMDGLSLFGQNLSHTTTLPHLLILTNTEIILIGEAEHVSEKQRGKYGGVWRYLPLRKLVSVVIEPCDRDQLCLHLGFSPNLQVERKFDVSRLKELETLKEALEGRKG